MTKTLLDITQEILSEMDSDDVNSISDTVESEQVANIVITVYRDMMSNRNWPHQKGAAVMTARSAYEFPCIGRTTYLNYEKLSKNINSESGI